MSKFALFLLVAFPGEKPEPLVTICAVWMFLEIAHDYLKGVM